MMAIPSVKFVEKGGIKFFDNFKAKSFKSHKDVNVFIPEQKPKFSIKAFDNDEKELGFYDLHIDKSKSLLEGSQLMAIDRSQNVGEILTLASLMQFQANRLNHFKFFSLEEAIPFHARYGFVIDKNDPDYVKDGLKEIFKSKAPNAHVFMLKAKYFLSKLASSEYVKTHPEILDNGNKVLSEYLGYLSSHHLNKYIPDFGVGANMKYSDWDIETNRFFLNPLLEKHKIDYEF